MSECGCICAVLLGVSGKEEVVYFNYKIRVSTSDITGDKFGVG